MVTAIQPMSVADLKFCLDDAAPENGWSSPAELVLLRFIESVVERSPAVGRIFCNFVAAAGVADERANRYRNGSTAALDEESEDDDFDDDANDDADDDDDDDDDFDDEEDFDEEDFDDDDDEDDEDEDEDDDED